MKREDQYKTAFVIKYGQFVFTQMPFGLMNGLTNVPWSIGVGFEGGFVSGKCSIFPNDIVILGMILKITEII